MKGMHSRYFLEETLSHLKPQQGLSERYLCRARRHEGLAPVSREGRSVGEFWLMTYQHLWLFLFYQLGDCK